MAMQAGAALGALGYPFGDFLIEQHVGMAARFAVVQANNPAIPAVAAATSSNNATQKTARVGLLMGRCGVPLPA
jgi:hypothetical protein